MKILTVDFETYWDRSEYTLSEMSGEEYVRDCRFLVHGVGISVNGEAPVYVRREGIPAVLLRVDWADTAVLCQNTAFDGFILSQVYNIKPAMWLDTMSMFRFLHPNKRASLRAITETLGLPAKGHEVDKTSGIRELPEDMHVRLGEYCKKDCEITWLAWEKMKGRVPPAELRLIDLTIRWAVQPVLELSQELLEEEYREEQAKKAALLLRISGDSKAFSSSARFSELLRERGVTPPIKLSPTKVKKDPAMRTRAEGVEKTIQAYDEAELPWVYAFGKNDTEFKQLLQHNDPEVVALVEARVGVKSTLAGTRAKRMLGISRGGAMPVPLIYWGAATGRWSATGGINLQNLPRISRLRTAIHAPKGRALVVCDLSAIEARVLAWLAGQGDVLTMYRDGTDLYCAMAEKIYCKAVTKNDKIERQVGKSVVLGCGYGMGWKRFADYVPETTGLRFSPEDACTMGTSVDWFMGRAVNARHVHNTKPSFVPLEEYAAHCAACERIITVYREAHRSITALWEDAAAALVNIYNKEERKVGAPEGVAYTCEEGFRLPGGRYIRYDGLHFENEKNRLKWFRETRNGKSALHGGLIVENVVQALARHIMAEQLLTLEAEGYHSVFTCHDEIILCEREDRAEAALTRMIEVMSTPPKWAAGLPLACVGGIGDNYGEAK